MSHRVIRQLGSFTGIQHLLLGVVLSVVLVGCSSSPSGGVSVVDRNGNAVAQRAPVTKGQYVVKRGDTLFSIAFRYGWDWKALAARNGIPEPFTIRPGQTIRFDGRSDPAPVVATSAPVVTSSATTSSGSGSVKTTVISKPVAVTPVVIPPAATTPGVAAERSPSGWAWPASGVLIGKFSSNGSLNKGIDIAGDLGQPVLAASDGSVVYAGSGLRGYGELIIIKHSDTYVSAYGHNRRLLVREGQQVKAGQTIAEMGSTGTDRVKLHFEIRRQGKPVDPLQFLPRR